MAKKPFSIDDAFDETLDDVVVRVYGSTTVEKPAYSGRTSVNNRPSHPDMTSTPSHGVHPQNPVLLSIRTGIMTDDVSHLTLKLYLFLKRLIKWFLFCGPDCFQGQ